MYVYLIYVLATYFLAAQGDSVDISEWVDEEDCGRTIYDDGSVELKEGARYKVPVGGQPWLVRLGVMDVETDKPVFFCGGSLISKQLVLTAIYCGTVTQVARLGENNMDKDADCNKTICAPPPQDIKIRKHICNADCHLHNKNNLELIVLERPAEINDFVRPICISNTSVGLTNAYNESLIVPGWDLEPKKFKSVHVNIFASDKSLMFVEVSILEKEECNKVYVKKLEVDQYCVGYPQGADKPCAGIAGGPMVGYETVEGVKRAYLVGVATYDLLTCEMGEVRPVIYSRPDLIPKPGQGVLQNVWLNAIEF